MFKQLSQRQLMTQKDKNYNNNKIEHMPNKENGTFARFTSIII